MPLNLPNIGNLVLEYDIEQTNEINKIADYVVEETTNYRKWASGAMEQWGTLQEVVGPINISSAGEFISREIEVQFGQVFATSQVPRVVVNGGTSTTIRADLQRIGIETYAIAGRFILSRMAPYNDSVSCRITYIAYGRWK